jgi:uncharacterized protein YkwD
MKHQSIFSIVVISLTLAVTSLFTPLTAYAQSTPTTIYLPLITLLDVCSMNQQEQELVDLIRTAPGQGRPSFRCNPILAAEAAAHARDMATRHYMGSINPEGYGPNYRVRQAGYPLPTYYSASATGNNIQSNFAGYTNAAAVWAASANNDQLYGNGEFWAAQTEFGIAYYNDPTSPLGSYWVVITAPPAP